MKKSLIVITGASSGIGEATARKFSNLGYPLLLIGRRLERLEALNLPDAICRKIDVTDTIGFKKAIVEAEIIYGPVDCLVNNAGVMLLGTTESQDPKEWKTMLDINIFGVLNGIHAILKSMLKRQQGTIINISSIAGRKTFPNHAVYCGTKFAVHAITENIREEIAQSNVRMSVIAPGGAVETELLSHTTNKEIKANYETWKKEMGSVLHPKSVADAIIFVYSQPQNVCVREVVIAATKQKP